LFNFEHESRSRAAGAISFRFGGSVLATSQLNSKSKIQEEARFQILRLLHDNPELTQRELGEKVGISLGAVNYCLSALVDKGLVKATNFSRNKKKRQYLYVLTPLGVAEKLSLVGVLLKQKRAQFKALRSEIEVLSAEFSVAYLAESQENSALANPLPSPKLVRGCTDEIFLGEISE